MKKILIDNKAVNAADTEVTFGAFNSPTPQWAKLMFTIVVALTTVLSAWVAATNLVAENWKFETILILKGVDTLALIIRNAFGITISDK